MRRLWPVLLAIALATAGCIGTADAGTAAKDPEGGAAEQAQSWNEDAQLVSVFAFEESHAEYLEDREEGPAEADDDNETADEDGNNTDDGDPFDHASSRSDGELTDGEARAWLYRYKAGNRSYNIVVDGNGTVLYEETEPAEEDMVPIQDWQIDSDEAADIIADNNETYANAENVRSTFYALHQNDTDQDPVWVFGVFFEDQIPVFYTVNATTGEYLGAVGFNFSMPSFSVGFGGSAPEGVPEEGGTFEGTVSLTEPTAEHTFEIDHLDHPELGVELALDEPATSAVNLTIEGPDGPVGTLGANQMEPVSEAWFEDPDEGEYLLTVELTGGATQDYSIVWCAEGGDDYDYDYGYDYDPYTEQDRSPCEAVDGERGD